MLTYETSLNGWLSKDDRGCWQVDLIPPPLTSTLNEIQKALEAKLFYCAIAVSLSIPDICASLMNDPDPEKLWTNRKKQHENYKKWFDIYLADKFSHFTAEDCYSIRCGVLHQGQFGRPDDNYDRIVFLGPQDNPSAGRIGFLGDIIINIVDETNFGEITGKVLNIEAIWFCEQIIDAARRWARAMSNDPFVRANLPKLVHYRKGGLPPYIVGQPIIA